MRAALLWTFSLAIPQARPLDSEIVTIMGSISGGYSDCESDCE